MGSRGSPWAALRRAYTEASEKTDAAADRARPGLISGGPLARFPRWARETGDPTSLAPPIPVNVEDFSELPAVVRPVEPDPSLN